MQLPDELANRIALTLGKRPVASHRVERGYTNAIRAVLTFADGSSCFLKAVADEATAGWLRAEYNRIYSQLKAPFLAQVLAWHDDGLRPLLLLEDLSMAFWPPPWSQLRVESVLETLAKVRRTGAERLPSIEAGLHDNIQGNWEAVAAAPQQFLSLGLCSSAWLEDVVAALIGASNAAPLDGDDLIHADVRSDNLCFIGERAVLVDWNNACRGSGDLDTAFWAPSLSVEGGPPPEAIGPSGAAWPALVSGYFAARAGLPLIPHAPRVRKVQLEQLQVALPWAQRALGLPPLDGPRT